MANRYWVGGTGTWNTTSTTNWSAATAVSFTGSTSGKTLTTTGSPALAAGMTVRLANNTSLGTIASGSGNTWTLTNTAGTNASQTMKAATVGASVPAATDSVFFDANSSGTTGYTVTMTGALTCLDFNNTSLTPTYATGTTPTLAVSGAMTLNTGTTWSETGTVTFNATSSKNITTNGVSFSCSVTFNGVAGTWVLQDNFTAGATNTVTLTNGTLNINDKTLTTGLFASNNSNTRTIAFGSGNITLTAATAVTMWTTATVTNLSITGTPVVNSTGGGANTKTINSGALAEASTISFNLQNTAGTVTFTPSNRVKTLALNGAFTLSNVAISIYGSYTYTASTTLSAGTGAWTFAATSGTNTLTSGGVTLNFPVTFNGVGGTWKLIDNLSIATTYTLTHTNGTLDLNGQTLTLNGTTTYVTAAGTKNLTFNGGTLICSQGSTTAFNNAAPTNYTTTAGTGTGTISMTSASAKTFVGGGSTFNCNLNQGGAGTLTISGSNTFNSITNTTQPATVTFTAGTTTTLLSDFQLSGTSGNLITINSSSAGSAATLSLASGAVSVSYCSIKDSTATGGATWNAYTTSGNVNVSGNTGWVFTAPLTPAAFMMFFKR